MTALIRQGGDHRAKSDDPRDIELWVDNTWRATWNTKGCKHDFPGEEAGQMLNNILNEAYEAGKRARSNEILNLLHNMRQ